MQNHAQGYDMTRSEIAKKANAARKEKQMLAKNGISTMALMRFNQTESKAFVSPPKLVEGISGNESPAVALDSTPYQYANQAYQGYSFLGYPYLASLATRAEYRSFASVLSTEITREFIEWHSANDDESSKEKIAQLEAEFKRLDVKGVIQKVAENDALFGRGQIFIGIKGQDKDKPLILSNKTIPIGSFERIASIEPMWTTPQSYSAIDPSAPDFYKPNSWFMMGARVHASRLLTVITRQVPDMLKPAFNFGGVSLSQLAEPYVENWLRTRQSVADIIAAFSVTVFKTDMGQILQGGDDGNALLKRAELFVAGRSNKGLAIVDKETEEIMQVNTPLSGLHELQAQAQEHLCSVSHIPSVKLTGISPSGLNASSDGEIKVFYDFIHAQQEAFYRHAIETIAKVAMLSLWGEIDETITFTFKSLDRVNDKEAADIKTAEVQADCAYLDRGVISAEEVREKIARDQKSGYEGLDLDQPLDFDNEANQDY